MLGLSKQSIFLAYVETLGLSIKLFARAAGLLLFYSLIIERVFMNSLRSFLR